VTGRQRIEAALSKDGTREIPAVICYEGIYFRDHWHQLTAYPWWYRRAPDIERQMLWRREVMVRTGQDWFYLPFFYSDEERRNLSIEVRPDGVYRIDRRTGTEERLTEPPVGGEPYDPRPDHPAETPEEIDAAIPPGWLADHYGGSVVDDGRDDLASQLLKECGGDLYPICSEYSPLSLCYDLWGFEGMMINIATRPDLVEHACQRFLALSIRAVRQAALLGAAGIWLEDCLTDMISPQAFARLNVPFVRQLVEEIRALGMKSIHYFCGNPAGKWELLLSVGADALSLEESKKGFDIDIENVVERVQDRCTVLGNLDAVGTLQDGSEEQLRAEIARQIAAGQRNGNRFIMSIGSPVTPGTPVEKVRLYCDLVHELGVT